MAYDNNQEPADTGSIWSGCCAQACPIPPSASQGGNQYCTFHLGSEYADFDHITTAIKRNVEHYNYYRKVSKWNIKEWKHGLSALRGYQYCPIEEHEEILPQPYLNRFFKTIIMQIKFDANNGAR